ncbi:MAG: 1-(5-phosphoribosyl)-5-[(5-phosphoribosylamino)methylideneamino]imidazole-4-carboxamide isomerase [Candidatus Hydrothermarchaeales archaeon]
MVFLVIPALDLKDKKCVQLRQGKPEDVIIELDDPIEVAERWESLGAPRLHVIDLDGAFQGKRVNEDIVYRIVEVCKVPVQFGGGIRNIGDARQMLDRGIEKIILGTLAIENPSVVEELAGSYGKDRIIIALDSRGGKVVIKGWKEKTEIEAKEIARRYEDYAGEVLFTNVDVEGLMEGFDAEVVKELVDSTSLGVIISGGISTLNDVEKAKGSGAIGCVLGSALYTGKLDFKEAIEVSK